MAYCQTDNDVTDGFQTVMTPSQVKVIRAATRLLREGAKNITDKLVRANAGVSHDTFFKTKKLLIQLGLFLPGWKILMPANWAEKARAARDAVLKTLREKAEAWQKQQKLWLQHKRQLKVCTKNGPTVKYDYKTPAKTAEQTAQQALFIEKYGNQGFNQHWGTP